MWEWHVGIICLKAIKYEYLTIKVESLPARFRLGGRKQTLAILSGPGYTATSIRVVSDKPKRLKKSAKSTMGMTNNK